MSFLCSCGNQTDNEEVIGGIVLHTCDACLQRIHTEDRGSMSLLRRAYSMEE